MQREEKKPVIGKRYISGTLEHMILTYPIKPSGKEEMEKGTWAANEKWPMLLHFVQCFVYMLVKREQSSVTCSGFLGIVVILLW